MQHIENISGALSLIDKYDTFFFDMDGVIWRGDEEVKGASATINTLKKANKKIFFLTNHPGFSRNGLLEKLNKMNIQIEKENVWGSAANACFYIK